MKPSHFDEARFDKANFNKALGSDPKNAELPSLAKALVSSGENPNAQQKLEQALQFEEQISRGFAIDPPVSLANHLLAIAHPARLSQKPAGRRRVWLAIAASLATCALVAGTWLWSSRRAFEAQLAADCVEHLSHEPFALSRTSRVPAALVSQLFSRSGLAFDADMVVNYLQPCVVNGQVALHIVFQRGGGPVMVLAFPDAKLMGDAERSIAGAQVRMRGFDGVGLVFMAESSRDFDAVEAKLIASLRFQRIQPTG